MTALPVCACGGVHVRPLPLMSAARRWLCGSSADGASLVYVSAKKDSAEVGLSRLAQYIFHCVDSRYVGRMSDQAPAAARDGAH